MSASLPAQASWPKGTPNLVKVRLCLGARAHHLLVGDLKRSWKCVRVCKRSALSLDRPLASPVSTSSPSSQGVTWSPAVGLDSPYGSPGPLVASTINTSEWPGAGATGGWGAVTSHRLQNPLGRPRGVRLPGARAPPPCPLPTSPTQVLLETSLGRPCLSGDGGGLLSQNGCICYRVPRSLRGPLICCVSPALRAASV